MESLASLSSDLNPSLPTELSVTKAHCHQSPLAGVKPMGRGARSWWSAALRSFDPLATAVHLLPEEWILSVRSVISQGHSPDCIWHCYRVEVAASRILHTHKALNIIGGADRQTVLRGSEVLWSSCPSPMRAWASTHTQVPSTMFSVKKILMRRWLSGPSNDLSFISQTLEVEGENWLWQLVLWPPHLQSAMPWQLWIEFTKETHLY